MNPTAKEFVFTCTPRQNGPGAAASTDGNLSPRSKSIPYIPPYRRASNASNASCAAAMDSYIPNIVITEGSPPGPWERQARNAHCPVDSVFNSPSPSYRRVGTAGSVTSVASTGLSESPPRNTRRHSRTQRALSLSLSHPPSLLPFPTLASLRATLSAEITHYPGPLCRALAAKALGNKTDAAAEVLAFGLVYAAGALVLRWMVGMRVPGRVQCLVGYLLAVRPGRRRAVEGVAGFGKGVWRGRWFWGV